MGKERQTIETIIKGRKGKTEERNLREKLSTSKKDKCSLVITSNKNNNTKTKNVTEETK